MRIAIALLTASMLAGCMTTPEAACDRACRLDVARVAATTGVIPAGVRVTQNGTEIDAAANWLKTASGISLHAAYGTDDSDAIVAGTARGADNVPGVFGLRVKVVGGVATEAELLVARTGEASLAPPSIPLAHDDRFDQIVPADKRTSAKAMIAAADAYFDGIETDDGKAVPVTETCNRVENGVQTTHTARFVEAGCNSLEAFAYITEVRDRRYPIVDEERGVVVGIAAFNIPGGDYKRMVNGQETTRHYEPRSLVLFEAFKLVDGKIEQIEATMRNVPLGATLGW